MRRHLHRSSNQVPGVSLEEDEGACGFAFPEGGLIPEGPEATRASAHVGAVRRQAEARHPGQCHLSSPRPVSDPGWPCWGTCHG